MDKLVTEKNLTQFKTNLDKFLTLSENIEYNNDTIEKGTPLENVIRLLLNNQEMEIGHLGGE